MRGGKLRVDSWRGGVRRRAYGGRWRRIGDRAPAVGSVLTCSFFVFTASGSRQILFSRRVSLGVVLALVTAFRVSTRRSQGNCSGGTYGRPMVFKCTQLQSRSPK